MSTINMSALWILLFIVSPIAAATTTTISISESSTVPTTATSASITEKDTSTTTSPEVPIIYNCSEQCLPSPPSTAAPCPGEPGTTSASDINNTTISNCNETFENCSLDGNDTSCDNSTGDCGFDETGSNGCVNITDTGDYTDNSTCNRTSGECLYGCQEGFAKPSCQLPCPENCTACTYDKKTNKIECEECSGNQFVDSGSCTSCSDNCIANVTSTSNCFMNNGTCKFGCPVGKFGPICQRACPGLCQNPKACDQFSGRCVNGCEQTKYCSPTCVQSCSDGCYRKDCNQDDCSCRTHCNDDFWDKKCDRKCSDNCVNRPDETKCNSTSGGCLYGCIDSKTWGDQCGNQCSENCLGNNCLQDDGNCTDGCRDKWFGGNCTFPCNSNCVNQNCSETDGTCLEGCKNEWYGPTCEYKCPVNCKNSLCDELTGDCSSGCETGWFGSLCNHNCSKTCLGDICNIASGNCANGCDEGFEGPQCLTQLTVSPEPPKDSLLVNIAIGVGSAVVIGIALAIVCGNRRRRQKIIGSARRGLNRITKIFSGDFTGAFSTNWIPADDYADPHDLFTDPKSRIKVEDILNEVVQMRSSRVREEFGKFETGIIKECSAAKRLENMTKNFYSDIFPYDENRVKLQLDYSRDSAQPGSDYINASYIRGLKRDKKYIAAQGPAKATVNDFWRMIWQENTTVVVMLINLDDDGSDNYWPEADTVSTYGSLTVKCVFRQPFADFIFREFKLSRDGQERIVRHLQYIRWPNLGVPPSAVDLIEFHQKYRALVKEYSPQGPIVVHCTAGVGRTGVFIALDIAVEDVMATGTCDLMETIHRLRTQRLQMVQLMSQFQFLYEAVAQEVVFGCILTSKAELSRKLDKLKIVQNWGKSQLQQSFQDLNASLALDDQDIACFDALQERGRKNRPTSEIPEMRYRPALDEVPYINAVNMDTYFRQNAIVATQMPSPDTIAEFCQLVIQKQCSTIVMLNTVDKKDKSLALYWRSRATYGRIKVTSRNVKKTPTYVIRNFCFQEQMKKGEGPTKKHEVQMIQYKAWDYEKDTVPNIDEFLELMSLARNRTIQNPDKSLLVHCLNGSDQTGLFCVLFNLIEKADTEKYINVVTTVRKVKTRRPTGLHKIAQYEFAYDAFIKYLCSTGMLCYADMVKSSSGSSGQANLGLEPDNTDSDDEYDDSDDDEPDFGFGDDEVRLTIRSSSTKEGIYDTM